MKEPKLTVAIAERGDQPVLLISRNDSELFNRVDWSFDSLAGMGKLGACAHIGDTVLKMLYRAHPAPFAAYPALEPDDELATPDGAIQYLLSQSVRDRSRAYIGAIDALLERHGDAVSAVTREHWPELRARFLRDYPA